MSQHQTIKN